MLRVCACGGTPRAAEKERVNAHVTIEEIVQKALVWLIVAHQDLLRNCC